MKIAALLLAVAACLALPSRAFTAVVNQTGYNNDFSVQPAADDWATLNLAGGANDQYVVDTDVNAIAASTVTTQVGVGTGDPPAAAGMAVWSSAGFLQTRPTGNRFTALMGKFVNSSGTNATEISISYLLTIAAGGIPEEAERGHRAYYSLTGAAGSWVNIAALNSTASDNGSSTSSATVGLNWPDGATLYLLWADDNATGQGTDAANQIDDFALRITAGAPLTLTAALTAPAHDAALPSGPVTASATLTFGTAPFSVEYFISSGGAFVSAGSSSMAPFNVSLGNLTPGTYYVYAVATDSAVPPASTSTATNTFFVADPMIVNLVRPPDGATVEHTVEVTAEAGISGGTAPYSVQFYLDGIENGPAINAPPYERNVGTLFVGDHIIEATVRDNRGWISNTPIHTVHITGPLGVALTPTNGASFIFGQAVTLAAAPGGGTGPYTVTFYVNGQAAGTATSAPFALPLGMLAAGSHTCYVHVADSSTPTPQQVDSSINAITVLPNPIQVNLTAPTNGQSSSAGVALSLAARATVEPPLSITNVQFFYDGNLAASDATSPYTGSVAAPAQGAHTVYAVATDNLGRQSASQTNQVTISAIPAGSNDNFNNAIPLFGPVVTTTGNNLTATRQGGFQGEPFHGGNFGGASVWWTWTATASGPTTIDTFGSDFNTLLGVYVGTVVNQLTTIAGNNDFEGNTWSRVQFNAVAGTVYRIAVDGFSAGFPPNPARGNIVLNIKGVGGVEITSPPAGAVFTVGDNIPVEVSITSDFPNPPATRVDFYLGGTLFGSDDAAPFSAVLSNAPAGSNTLSAIALDSTGQPIQSPPVRIFVQRVGVTILTPFEDTIFPSTNPITVTAWAYLPGAAITNIEFYIDGVKFGEDSTAPYAATWDTVTPGSHRFLAVGRGDNGLSYNSQPVNFGVASVLLPFAAVWKYLDDGSDQGTNWISPDFDDSAWLSGPAPLGYSDSNGRLPATTNQFGPNPNAKYTNYYYRTTFTAASISTLSNIILGIERDDGAVVYLNGAEIGRFNMPTGMITSTTLASSNAGDDGGTVFTLAFSPGLLREGLNSLAVEIHQDQGTSSDIWFQMTLVGVPIVIHNLSPLVSITMPTNHQYFLAPESIQLEAEASDPDGSVAKVEYFADGVEIGEATDAPYTVSWLNPSVAAHSLTAVATDDLGGTTVSEPVAIVVYDAVGTPVAAITSPVDGAMMEGPTNLLVTATANAITGVSNVLFLADGVEFGSDGTAPYSAMWTAPFGTSVLRAVAIDASGVMGTSPPVSVVITIPPTNVIAPTITAQFPAASSTVTNLTNITVRFSEYVQNIDASDLLINGVPATAVNASHSRSNYTFTFAHPPYGAVNVSWAPGHGITDYGWPTVLPFDEAGPGASWTYDLVDQTPPVIAARTPAAATTVTNLAQISVRFSEAVSGVEASDLLINGFPAIEVNGDGSNFVFRVSQPPSGTVNIAWATNHNIFDLATTPNLFNRTNGAWSFTLDARQLLVQSNSVWRFVKGTAEASSPPDAWRQLDFDDSGWSNAPGPFFFGDTGYTNANNRGTLLSDMLNNYSSIYLRQEFLVLNRGDITNLVINAQSDDGFIAWVNGVEVRRYNSPTGQPPYNVVATVNAPEPNNNGAGYVVAPLNTAAAALVDGRNVIAIQAFNQHATNNDFGFNAQLYTFPQDSTTVPPRLLTPIPTPGDVQALSSITVSFSESVSGVDASDLLVNGVPAVSMTSNTNTTYAFSFAQPPYGTVQITWDPDNGIQDFDGPPRAFNASAPGSTFSYFLINPSNPKVLAQTPSAGSTVTGLTAVVVTFTEAVSGVGASDFLVNGFAAASVSSSDNITYNFGFSQPSYGPVTIRWATNHNIVDVEAGNPFDPTRFGGQWNYLLVDPAPAVTITSPTNNTYRLQPATVTINANASDNDGTVTRVDFYDGATLVGGDSNAPYSLTLSNLLRGVYTFRAVASDNMGLLGTSAPVVLNVVTSLPAALVRGPYLQIGTPTSGVVRWRSDVPTDGLVFYGTDPSNLTNFASETTVTNEHIVQISGLEPDTKYYYSIGSAAQRLAGTNGVGSDYWFQTSPVPGTRKRTRLWILGDAGTAGNGAPDRQQSTRNAFYNYAATNGQPDLWLMLGDNAYNVGSDIEHQRAVFDMYPTTLRNKFLWPTLGNHETSMSTTATDFPYLHIFSLPRNGEAGGIPSGTEKYYSFDYGNIHFVCLDSMTSGQTGNTPMANWLREDLAAANAEWIIVFFHHPPYTKGSHNSDTEQDLVNIRQNLVPIMESNGVDLVLSGHSHCYERSYLLHGHYGMSTTLTESMKINGGDGRDDGDGPYQKNAQNHGVVYTVAGSSGQATFLTGNLPGHFITLLELGSMVIDVHENRLDALFLRENGLIQDRFTLLKPDLRPASPLHLVAHPAGPDSITLQWADMGTNELGFSIERSTDGVNFAERLAAPADAIGALDTGLVMNVTYYYRVRSTNDIGVSQFSNIASATPVLATAAPQAPSNLIAASDDGVSFYRSRMIVSWVDRSSDEGAFQIERSQDALVFVPVATVGANITSFLDQGLESASLYFYRVRAVNPMGVSAPSTYGGDETHPQSQLVRAGDAVSFHAGIEGAPGMSYQWQFMGSPISGANSETLTLASAQPSHQGEYTVVLTDTNGKRITSNPATLIVVSPPRIVAQPQDYVRGVGMSVEFAVAAEGTPPLRYYWRKNGSHIGVNTSALNLSGITFADQAGYDVIVENDFGAVTSRLALLTVYSTPSLAAVPDIFAEVLKQVRLTMSPIDENVPPLNLRFSLAPGAPTNSVLDPFSGYFRWTPNRFQAPSTNPITVNVYDLANPILSGSASFNILVNHYAELGLGSLVMLTGTNGAVPLTLFSSLDLAAVESELHFAGEHFTSITLETPESANTIVNFQRESANSALINIEAPSGGTLLGMNHIGNLRFVARNQTNSAAVPLHLAQMLVTPAVPGATPTALAQDGQVVVVGTNPLLAARLNAQGGREVTVFGRPGNYNLQFATNLVNPIWRPRGTVTVATNSLTRSIATGNNPPTNLPAFFRIR